MNNKELIKDALQKIEKKFGKEAIMLLSNHGDLEIDTFSSGSLVINEILGIGGYPRGRIIEVFGPESSGKTTIALHAIAEIQKAGGIAAFIDVEHSIDPTYAKRLGVDIDNLILSQPDSGEQALEIVDTLAKTGSISLIIVDSVAALVPEAELNGEMKDQTIGLQARLMSKALRKITGTLSNTKTTIIFINQIRMRIGTFFGSAETTPGGKALKYSATIRLEVRKISTLGQGTDIRGNEIRLRIVKNKLAPPFKFGKSEIIFSKGISYHSEIIQYAERFGLIKKYGSWYKKGDQNLAQGKVKLAELLEKDHELFKELEKEILLKLKNENKID